MKKIVSLLLVGIMCISLSACTGSTTETKEVDVVKYSIGDTVSTDIFDFTLENAEFAIACENDLTSKYLEPKEYDASSDSGNPYVASIGETLVALTFTIKNNNRTSMNIASSFGDWDLTWNVSYQNEDFMLLNQWYDTHDLDLDPAAVSSNGTTWERQDTENDVLEAGDVKTYRTYGRISTDVENLTDSFEITVNVPTGSQEDEMFVFVIE